MGSFDNLYSRAVIWVKIVLPLLALGLLSTLFLFSRNLGPDRGVPYLDADTETLAREPRLSAPAYAGVAKDGAAVSVAARVVRPGTDNDPAIRAQELTATIDAADGLHVELSSDRGAFHEGERRVVLSGAVRAETSTGFRIWTEELVADLDGLLLGTETTVTAESPFGTLEAGRMEFGRAAGSAEESYVLVFNGGVKLVYAPRNEGE